MSDRRRMLLAIAANTGSWETFSQQYLYYTLIPQTINTKSVKNKAKVSKIYGNGVIENQLVVNGNFLEKSNWTTYNLADTTWSVSDNVATVVVNSMTSSYGQFYQNVSVVAGHKYLLTFDCKASSSQTLRWRRGNEQEQSFSATTNWQKFSFIETRSHTGTDFGLYLTNALTTPITIYLRNVMYIDLTLMFGTGNEPTTLTDNRIQNILNRDYIPYNLGEYKGTDIGDFSTTKEDTTALDTITFKAQLNGFMDSHDTMEITKANVVFTHNRGSYVFTGNETVGSWNNDTNNYGYLINMGSNWNTETISGDSTVPSFAFEYLFNATYGQVYRKEVVNAISQVENDGGNNNRVVIRSSTITTTTDMKTWLTGKILRYPLATPQVITIPRKHLGIVDLGTLSYSSLGSGTFSITDNVGKTTSNNLYVSSLITTDFNSLYNKSVDSCIARATNGKIWLYNSAFASLSNQQIKEKLSGTLLFYETENEVADITDTIDIESGGTITSNWFSWVENQMISPTMLRPTSSFTHNGITFSRDTTNATIHVYGLCSGAMTIDITDTLSITSGHKYLLNFTSGGSINTYYVVEAVSNTKCIGSDLIKTLNSSTAKYGFYIANGQNIDITFKPQLVDLTVGFDNEPTNVNDPRIQYIINKGYIPMNTTGTLKSVATEVLPNVDLSVKCK